MKTQISNLRSGVRKQILNPKVDYPNINKSTSGYTGSNSLEVEAVWEKVVSENPKNIRIKINGQVFTLEANWSVSKKSVYYVTFLKPNELKKAFGMIAAKRKTPILIIHYGNRIEVTNGKNIRKYICPSLIEIL